MDSNISGCSESNFGFFLMNMNIFSIYQFWSFLFKWIKKLSKKDSIEIPPNSTFFFLINIKCQSTLDQFILFTPWSIAFNIVVDNPFFVPSDNGSLSWHLKSKARFKWSWTIEFDKFNLPTISQVVIRQRECINAFIAPSSIERGQSSRHFAD